MKCHYKVLELETTANDSEIKAAYRRLAMKWHPDKNLDNVDHAKEEFQLVQQAYEILSDRQERAWYDKYRDQMLIDKDYLDEALDVFQFFTTTCFNGFGDDENGFYAVYRSVFDKISTEDLEHTEENDYVEVPSFGYSTSDYNKVVGPFYTFWMSYNTKRSYAWLNPHNLKDAPNRQVFKLAEKENKKVRQKAKKERNEEVRGLVSFVRKRDKRVQINMKQMEAKVIKNRQKQEELSKQKKLERKRELTEAKPLAEWMKLDNVDEELKAIERDLAEEFGEEISDEDDEESLNLNHLYCVACDKGFKSARGFQNHEASKKHRQNVATLKLTMVLEDELVNENGTEDIEPNEDLLRDKSVEIDDKENETKSKKKKKKGKKVIQVNMHGDILENKTDAVDDTIDQNDCIESTKKNQNATGISPSKDDDNKNKKERTENQKKSKICNVTLEAKESKQRMVSFERSRKLFDLGQKDRQCLEHVQTQYNELSNIPRWKVNKIRHSASDRNKGPILEVIQKHIPESAKGEVLEIASGCGIHCSFFAEHFPNLTFQASEFNLVLFPSIKAFARDTSTKNVRDPIELDVTKSYKLWGLPVQQVDYILNINMVHITPYQCSISLFENVSQILKPDGLMFMYGPFACDGIITPQSNIDFDKILRRQNKEWGVRDICDLIILAKANKMDLIQKYDLPANNKCLVWKRLKDFP
ncbi:hypothetical protein FQA39_LY02713 [Lamprigera yunnana]|nr:hypothetical protein FQA39_LY02713 [Lamprigera yunnana]